MKTKIAFVCLGDFNDLTDTKNLVIELSRDYEVSFFGYNSSINTCCKDELNHSFDIKHFHFKVNSLYSKIKFMIWLRGALNEFGPRTVYLSYFPMCSIFSFLYSNNIILDIRSSIISEKKIARNIKNLVLKIESMFFKRISIISEGLAKFLSIELNKCIIVPLGADQNSEIFFKKEFNNFLYVGTFNFRRLTIFLKGFDDFIKSQSHNYPPKLHFVGTGMEHEVRSLKKLTIDLNLQEYVDFRGEVRGKELIKEFEWATFGISYIPMTSYFDCQPPTKTFEYLACGIPVMATSTLENKKIINSENGILCDDDASSVCSALTQLVVSKKYFNSDAIRSTVSMNTWKNIASTHFPLPKD